MEEKMNEFTNVISNKVISTMNLQSVHYISVVSLLLH